MSEVSRDTSVDSLLNAIASGLFELPAGRTDAEKAALTPLGVVALFMDFEASVATMGLFGYVRNGFPLSETIEAFKRIRAPIAAGVLESLSASIARRGITPQQIQNDYESVLERLGPEVGDLAAEIDELEAECFLNTDTPEDPYQLLSVYAVAHLDEIETRYRELAASPAEAERN